MELCPVSLNQVSHSGRSPPLPRKDTTIVLLSYRSSTVKKTVHVHLLVTNPITHYSHATSIYLHPFVHAGTPIVTGLTFDDQSRTLTCTSTGGPATTVTWRRDGDLIIPNATHQQTKRLIDPVNGTYQTVLTIDSSDIAGTYNCTVENDRIAGET